MDLPKGWRGVEAKEAAVLEAEIARELSPAHALSGLRLSAIARNLGRDDALFRNLASVSEVCCVHLTWRAESDPTWPHCVRYESLAAFVQRWAEDSAEGLEP